MINSDALWQCLERLKTEASYSNYSAVANALAHTEAHDTGWDVLRVAVLRNFTIEPLIPVIKGEIASIGYYPKIFLGDFDAIPRDVFNPDSALFQFNPDMIILAQWLDTLSPDLSARFPSLKPEQVSDLTEGLLTRITDFVASIRKVSSSPIFVNNFPLPPYPALGILDAQSEHLQTHTILTINQGMVRRLSDERSIYIIDFMSLMARIGGANTIDDRYWQIGKAPIGRKCIVEVAREYGKFIRALRGKVRKCLILDCDNTLWGGIIGEDGMKGIQLGTDFPGSGYREFQREILNLHDRGVILAMCSKNNEADVLEVLHRHPECLLREENFATWQINWEDKATNIKRIAGELNIGLDSLVFVDDNPFECNFIREQLPQVAVIQLPTEPSRFKNVLMASALFDSLAFSAEDRRRNKMYRDQAIRVKLQSSAASLEEYLRKLEIVAEIALADEAMIPRISQLTQKTNQFNLTTTRYTEGDIRGVADKPGSDVCSLKVRDKISDLGLVGVAIVKYYERRAEIDTFLLSCRALGRGVEMTLLAWLMNFCRTKGFGTIIGRYRKTAKNGMVENFFPEQGFELVRQDDHETVWEKPLSGETAGPDWINMTGPAEDKSGGA
jgi:FkbH-like protein